jgi:hypothetical protein
MAMSATAVVSKTNEVWKAGNLSRAKMRRLARYARGQQKLPYLPDSTDGEYREIAKKSASNWVDLVIRSTTQGLFVDGYGDSSDSDLWTQVWQPNGMDARQHALHRAVETLGHSYLIGFPTGEDGVWMRPEAATKLTAEYEDPSDDWPVFAVREVVANKRYELYDDEARYTMEGRLGKGLKLVETAPHDLDHAPIVKMRSSLDLLGEEQGQVEGIIPIQDRIVDATFTMQMVAKYGAFPQRWISGIDMSKPLEDDEGNVIRDADGNPKYPTIKAYIDSILLAADPEAKFGQFTAADLRQYVEALEAHIRHLAAVTQTPPHYLLGSLVNLSAEALAAAEAGLQRKIGEKKVVLGEGYEQAMRMGAVILGETDAASDFSSQVRWRDIESRSLAQVADAMLKLTQMGIPVEFLVAKLPGFSGQDVADINAAIEAQGGVTALVQNLLNGQLPKPEPLAA